MHNNSATNKHMHGHAVLSERADTDTDIHTHTTLAQLFTCPFLERSTPLIKTLELTSEVNAGFCCGYNGMLELQN